MVTGYLAGGHIKSHIIGMSFSDEAQTSFVLWQNINRRHDIDDFTIAIDNCALSGKRHSSLNLQLFAGGNDALVLYIDYLSLASRNPSAITAVIYHFPPPLTPSQLKKIDPFYYRQ